MPHTFTTDLSRKWLILGHLWLAGFMSRPPVKHSDADRPLEHLGNPPSASAVPVVIDINQLTGSEC